MKKNIILLMGLTFIFIGCSSIKIVKEKVRDVKRIAIIGFHVQQQQPLDSIGLLKIATHVKLDTESTMRLRKEANHVNEMYDNLAERLKSEQNFTVISREALAANSSYKRLFKEKTEGFQNRPPIDAKFELLQPQGILDSFAIQTTKADDLKKLQLDLGVDAIVTVSMTVNLNLDSVLGSLVGKAEFSPSANSYLRMLDASTGQEIWSDTNAEGEKIKSNEKTFLGLANQEKINKLAVEAAKSSYRAMLDRYKESLLN